jgi:hypothetical protein
MRNAQLLHQRVFPVLDTPRTRPTARFAARVRAPWLDRELAAGVAPWRSRTHAARALQLTGDRHRRALARRLEDLIERADRPHTRFMNAALPPCPDQVSHAVASILAIAARLRDGAPVDARGVARLGELLSDGVGPCYAHMHPGALATALEAVAEWLQAPD